LQNKTKIIKVQRAGRKDEDLLMLTSESSIKVFGEVGKTRVPDRAVRSSSHHNGAHRLKGREKIIKM
jgi:hypothetical protein